MLIVIVKGGRTQAAQAAANRGISLEFVREIRGVETVGRVADAQLDKVQAWFCEPGQAPYPIGALLHWSQAQSPVES